MSDAIVLVGAGRHCHNLVGHLETIGWTVSYILDDDPGAAVLDYEVRSLDAGLERLCRAHLSVGNPQVKRQILAKCQSFPAVEWIRIIHPTALISLHAQIAQGCLITPFVTVADIVMAEHSIALPYTLLGARVEIGACSLVSSHCSIHSDVRIGEDTVIGSGVQITAGVRIGNRCRIAPNAVVNNDVPDDHLVVTANRTRMVPLG